jgi:hypothetical protein
MLGTVGAAVAATKAAVFPTGLVLAGVVVVALVIALVVRLWNK